MGATVNRKATITVDEGRRDIDALEHALKLLRDVGHAPGNARVTVAGAGPGKFIVSAEWLSRPEGEPSDQESERLQP